MAVKPSAAMQPYIASAVAAPSPDTKPTSRPIASVRRMQRTPIGPTGAAMARPRMKPRRMSAGTTLPS